MITMQQAIKEEWTPEEWAEYQKRLSEEGDREL